MFEWMMSTLTCFHCLNTHARAWPRKPGRLFGIPQKAIGVSGAPRTRTTASKAQGTQCSAGDMAAESGKSGESAELASADPAKIRTV